MSAPKPPTVIYIAGSGRSGSTLLERALGGLPGFVNVGELIDLFRRVAEDDERCGCGHRFSTCPFWRSVGERAFDGWSKETVEDIAGLQARVARQRHLPRLLSPVATQAFHDDTRHYRHLYARIYRSILAESGAEYVVDASKWPAQALALRGMDIDLRVIHLVRDVRGVAHSMHKRSISRPHAADGHDQMAQSGPVRAAVDWTLAQTEVDLIRLRGARVTRMRYQDFVESPGPTMQHALTRLGVVSAPHWFEHVGRRELTLGASHGLSGNPSRFQEGVINLRPDEEWRSQMSLLDRATVTAIGLPQLLVTRSMDARRRRVQQPAGPSELPTGQLTDWPAVSVVVVTKDRRELVRESVRSVIAQTYPGDIECLVVHDQEEPDLALVDLGTEGRKVTVLTNVRASGLAGARNTGLDATRAEFVATCDDDDTWHPTKLEKQISLLVAEPDLLMVGSGIRLLYPGGRTIDWPGRSTRVDRAQLVRNRIKELHSSTLVMRADVFAKAGQYDESLPYGYAEDYDFLLRVSRVGQIGLIEEPLADIQKGGASFFRDRAGMTIEGLTALLQKHPEFTASRRGHARLLGQLAFSHAAIGQRSRAASLAGRSLIRYPFAPYAYLTLFQLTTRLDPRIVMALAARMGRGIS